MKFTKTTDSEFINKLRTALYQKFTAPLDAMWEILYIASAQDYLITEDSQTIGYCCIDDQKSLLQIYLKEEHNYQMANIIQALITSDLITSASLSAIEPISFNACLFHSKSTKANTFCYQYFDKNEHLESLLNIKLVSEADIPEVKNHLLNQVGFNDNFGYTKNLVQRKEIYLLKDAGKIIATGECRLSDTQEGIADIGMIVHKDHRKRGLGTQMLKTLAQKAKEANRKPICSTTLDNIASQKAIERAGFYCEHIIFDINFTE